MKFTPEYIPRTKVEVVVEDDQVDLLLSKIMDRLGNDEISGKIFVLEVLLTLDIKTGKKPHWKAKTAQILSSNSKDVKEFFKRFRYI